MRMPRTSSDVASLGAYVRAEVQADLQRAGFNEPTKLYAVYYDGASTYACGGGACAADGEDTARDEG
jgi:hypothetical protein